MDSNKWRVNPLIFIFTTLLILSACSINSSRPILSQSQQQKIWLKHKADLNHIQQWSISGRFGAQNEVESWNGSIQWTQDQDKYSIHVSGPLSSGSFSLEGNSEQSTLKLSKNKIYTAPYAELLLETHTGIHLPIKHLRYWLLGLPSPLDIRQNKQIILNDNGLITTQVSQGWNVAYKKYKKTDGIFLPKKVFLENKEYDVRLIIRNWQITL